MLASLPLITFTHNAWRIKPIPNLLSQIRKRVTSDGMWAMLGVGTIYTEVHGTELSHGHSCMLICPSAPRRDTYHDIAEYWMVIFYSRP